MAKRWYYQMLMEEFGPVTAEQLSVLISEGTVSDTDLVRSESSDQWIEASGWTPEDDDDVASGVAGDVEDISDLSELTFEFENAGAAERKRTPAASASERPRVSTVPEHSRIEEDPDPAIYFYQSLGQTLGPLPLSSLVSLAESGAISEVDQVRITMTGLWKPASTVRELQVALQNADRSLEQSTQMTEATRKRLGALATENALAQEKPDVKVSESAVEQPLPQEDDLEPARTSRGKKRSEARPSRNQPSKSREEALIEDILGDVFSEDTPARKAAIVPPAPLAPAMGGNPVREPVSNAQAAFVAAAPRQVIATPPKKSASRTSSVSGGLILKSLLGLLLAGGVGAGVYFGMPAIQKPPMEKTVTTLRLIAEDVKKLGDSPTEQQWAEFAKKKSEFSNLQSVFLDVNAKGEDVDRCKKAITLLLKLTIADFKDKKVIQQTSNEFVRAVNNLN